MSKRSNALSNDRIAKRTSQPVASGSSSSSSLPSSAELHELPSHFYREHLEEIQKKIDDVWRKYRLSIAENIRCSTCGQEMKEKELPGLRDVDCHEYGFELCLRMDSYWRKQTYAPILDFNLEAIRGGFTDNEYTQPAASARTSSPSPTFPELDEHPSYILKEYLDEILEEIDDKWRKYQSDMAHANHCNTCGQETEEKTFDHFFQLCLRLYNGYDQTYVPVLAFKRKALEEESSDEAK